MSFWTSRISLSLSIYHFLHFSRSLPHSLPFLSLPLSIILSPSLSLSFSSSISQWQYTFSLLPLGRYLLNYFHSLSAFTWFAWFHSEWEKGFSQFLQKHWRSISSGISVISLIPSTLSLSLFPTFLVHKLLVIRKVLEDLKMKFGLFLPSLFSV
jgi:hypothetical protein